jgi:hypothetical protein
MKLEPEIARDFVARIRSAGIERRDLETGEVVERSDSAALAARLQEAIETGHPFVPTPSDQEALIVFLNSWLDDVKVEQFRESAKALRYALHREIHDRRSA